MHPALARIAQEMRNAARISEVAAVLCLSVARQRQLLAIAVVISTQTSMALQVLRPGVVDYLLMRMAWRFMMLPILIHFPI